MLQWRGDRGLMCVRRPFRTGSAFTHGEYWGLSMELRNRLHSWCSACSCCDDPAHLTALDKWFT